MISLDHVQLAAPAGCEKAARFYFGGLLGLPELEKQGETAGSGGAWFQLGMVELHVGVDKDFRPAKKAHVALRVADLDGMAERLQQAGYPVLWDTRLPGMRRFFTVDPWGNRMELLTR